MPYSASMIQYGTMVQGRNGICRSQSNTIEGTAVCSDAVQLANAYVAKKNGPRNASHASARRHG